MTGREREQIVREWLNGEKPLRWWQRFGRRPSDQQVRAVFAHMNARAADEAARRWTASRLEAWRVDRAMLLGEAEANRELLDGVIESQTALAEPDPQMTARLARRLGRSAHDGVTDVGGAVEKVLRWWNQGYASYEEQRCLQAAALSTGLADPAWVTREVRSPQVPKMAEFYEQLLMGIYQRTQQMLADAGIEGRVRLYRAHPLGPRFSKSPAWSPVDNDADHEQISMQPLLSCSTSADFVECYERDRFARPPHDPTAMPQAETDVYLLELLVPAERIVSTPRTGFGNDSEHEIVVAAGDPWPVEILTARAGRRRSLLAHAPGVISRDRVIEEFPPPQVGG